MLAKSQGVSTPGKWILNLFVFYLQWTPLSLPHFSSFITFLSFFFVCPPPNQAHTEGFIIRSSPCQKLGSELEDIIAKTYRHAAFFLFVLQCSMWAATSVSVCVCIHIKVSVSIWLSVPVSVGLWVGNWARFNSRWSTGAEKVPWVCLIGHATVPLRKFSTQRLMFHCSWGKLIQENITHNSPPTVHNRGVVMETALKTCIPFSISASVSYLAFLPLFLFHPSLPPTVQWCPVPLSTLYYYSLSLSDMCGHVG